MGICYHHCFPLPLPFTSGTKRNIHRVVGYGNPILKLQPEQKWRGQAGTTHPPSPPPLPPPGGGGTAAAGASSLLTPASPSPHTLGLVVDQEGLRPRVRVLQHLGLVVLRGNAIGTPRPRGGYSNPLDQHKCGISSLRVYFLVARVPQGLSPKEKTSEPAAGGGGGIRTLSNNINAVFRLWVSLFLDQMYLVGGTKGGNGTRRLWEK